MKFSEKLERLTAGMRRAELSRDAGIKPSVLNNYINRGSEPMGFAALKLAKKLKVSLEWLLDENAEWPPPAPPQAPAASDLTDDALMFEVAKRLRLAELDLWKWVEEAEKIDWEGILNTLESLHDGDPLPPTLEKARAIAVGFNNAEPRVSDRFNPFRFSVAFHERLPGGHYSTDALMDMMNRGHNLSNDRTFQKAKRRLVDIERRREPNQLFRPGSNWSLAAENTGNAPHSLPALENPTAEEKKPAPPSSKTRKKK